VKTPTLPGLTAGKTACHGPAAATAGFFLNLAKNSPVNGCTRIDEALGANVSSSAQKSCPFAKQKGLTDIFFVSHRELNISAVLKMHKQTHFCFKSARLVRTAPTRDPLRVPPCIGATVHLYSGSLFGY
jgi:hypothetical protein